MGGKKAGGGFLGIGGESGFLNTGLLGSGPKKIKGFEMSGPLRQAEDDMIARQNAIASGQGKSISQMQFDRNIDQSNQQALALAASQRGASNPMLAFRNAQMLNQQNTMEGAQQGAILAEQERRQAEQLIAAQAASQRGVAFNQATTNQGAKLQGQAQNAQAIAGLGGTAAAISDENAKMNIRPANDVSSEINNFMNQLNPLEYEYRDPVHGTGKKVGIMAQDLEKSKIGQTMVDEDANGLKRVDTNKAIGAILAATAEMHKEIKALKKKA